MPLIVVVLLFVAEVTAVVALGSAIGVAPTVALVVGTSVLGVLLLRNQGRRTLAALRAAQTTHRSPGRELADGALGGVGALLMVLPGLDHRRARAAARATAHPGVGASLVGCGHRPQGAGGAGTACVPPR